MTTQVWKIQCETVTIKSNNRHIAFFYIILVGLYRNALFGIANVILRIFIFPIGEHTHANIHIEQISDKMKRKTDQRK